MASASINETCPRPVILDLDHSVSGLDNAHHIPLSHWQDNLRFSCGWSSLRHFGEQLSRLLPEQPGCVFLGSGDYHHLSYVLLQRLQNCPPFQLIICDNHPDNMRFPFGIHCGSWVYWATRLPQITQVHVLGIGSEDISMKHAWENHLSPLVRGKLTYWSLNVNTRWMNKTGAAKSNRSFTSPDALIEAFLAQKSAHPVYLSIDKDVLSQEIVQTNWDQGQFHTHHLDSLINACRGQLIGADITGEVSVYHYQSRVKRWLSALDGQQEPDACQISEWQQEQNQLNQHLLAAINQCW